MSKALEAFGEIYGPPHAQSLVDARACLDHDMAMQLERLLGDFESSGVAREVALASVRRCLAGLK